MLQTTNGRTHKPCNKHPEAASSVPAPRHHSFMIPNVPRIAGSQTQILVEQSSGVFARYHPKTVDQAYPLLWCFGRAGCHGAHHRNKRRSAACVWSRLLAWPQDRQHQGVRRLCLVLVPFVSAPWSIEGMTCHRDDQCLALWGGIDHPSVWHPGRCVVVVPPGHSLVTPGGGGGGGGGLFGALPSPGQPSHPPTSENFSSGEK